MRRFLTLLLSLLVVLAASLPAGVRAADYATQEVEQARKQPLNNAPIWQEIRSGQPQYASLPGKETSILINPGGQTWRAVRNGELAIYGGWALMVMFMAISAYYFLRGRINLAEPETGRAILRFTAWERITHWITAICFVILAVSGLVMFFGKGVLLPVVGHTLFGWLASVGKNLHNFVGPLFVVSIVMTFVTFVRDNMPRKEDFLAIVRLGGLIGGAVPSHKYNTMEKIWFWGGLMVLGIVLGATGLILDFPNFDQTRYIMQKANEIHFIGATLFMLGAMGHIYMGTVGMQGAYRGMRDGYVDESWAKEHHPLWYADVKAGKILAESVPTAELATRRFT
jgi:formate dehydrogenase subunit gamma